MLDKFIKVTLKPLLIIGGAGTALAGAYAFFPEFSVTNIQKIDWEQEYTIFVQHWGMMVLLMGLFMIAAAFKESWRYPIMLYAMIEKAFMVLLAVLNFSHSFSEGFYIPAILDAIIAVYCLLYFISLRRN